MRIIVSILCICISVSLDAQIVSQASGNWNNAATWVGGVVPDFDDNVQIVSNHAITLTANAEVNNIDLTDGSIAIGSYKLSIYGDISGAESNNIISTASSTLEILDNGSAGSFTFPTGIVNLLKLTINRSAGATTDHTIDLDNSVPADSIVLVLTNGIIYMNNNSVLQMNSEAIKRDIPCTDASHIDGSVQRMIQKNNGMHIYPVGDNGLCRPMALQAANGNSNIEQIQFLYATPPISTTVNTSNLPGGIMQHFYWKHDNLSGVNMQRRLYFEDSDFPGFSDAQLTTAVYLANSDGVTEWDRPVNPRLIDVTNNFVQFNNASAANKDYWTFGSVDAAIPIDEIFLPIELTFFDVALENEQVLIKWQTATETNNDFFTIERSQNGIEFIPIHTVNGNINSKAFLDYEYKDENPFHGISYYRLKQTDLNGEFTYSAIVELLYSYSTTINMRANIDGYIICEINTFEMDEFTVTVYDLQGRIIEQKSEFITPGIKNIIELDLSIAEATVLLVDIESSTISKKIKFYNQTIH